MTEFRPEAREARFAVVFRHLGAVTAYARRRGSRDAEAVAAEAMLIAWRRLADVPRGGELPWLYVTARNLIHAERRGLRESVPGELSAAPGAVDEYASLGADPAVATALRSLNPREREALLLVAWDDLAPAQAAALLGISPTAFRMRLMRARRSFRRELELGGERLNTAILEPQ
jgi:RNA polymerase sigma-70 factor, ECF subfamily